MEKQCIVRNHRMGLWYWQIALKTFEGSEDPHASRLVSQRVAALPWRPIRNRLHKNTKKELHEVFMNLLQRSVLVQRSGLALVAAAILTSLPASGQESYYRAKRQQHYHDARHHTKAKIVGGSAAGGAVVGGLLGGGKGALIGAGAGAGGGLIANHEREKHDVQKRQEYGR